MTRSRTSAASDVYKRQVKEQRLSQGELGHLKKHQAPPSRWLREFPKVGDATVGQTIKVDMFKKGDWVDVVGVSKGKGFQGVVRRHNYAGGPETHGSMFHRAPGSIGASSYPSRVWKNKALPGHMGDCLLYTSPSPRDRTRSRMPSSA